MPIRPLDIMLAFEIGLSIKRRRTALRITQDELAFRSTLSGQAIISQYELGKVCPSVTTLYDIAMALECEARDLLPDNIAIRRPLEQTGT